MDVSLCSRFCTLQSKLHSKHNFSAVPGSRNFCSPGSHKYICLCRRTKSAKEHYLMMAAWYAKVAPSLSENRCQRENSLNSDLCPHIFPYPSITFVAAIKEFLLILHAFLMFKHFFLVVLVHLSLHVSFLTLLWKMKCILHDGPCVQTRASVRVCSTGVNKLTSHS